jgi:hypothetical protein
MSRATGAAAAGAISLAILTGMMVRHAWPLWTGTRVVLQAVPVDPRDLFRGEFVRLATPANRVLVTASPASTPGAIPEVRPVGEWWADWPRTTVRGTVYVQLEQGAAGESRPVTISRRAVPGAVNLRGRIRPGDSPPVLRIEYGLDAFYMEERTARPVEHAIGEGRKVQMEVSIAGDGRARIRNLIIDGTPLPRR